MKIKILSPVHIGSGERKNKLSFILKNNNAYFINEDLFASLITTEGLIDKFIQWATGGGSDISEFLKGYPQIEKKLIENSLYVLPIKEDFSREVLLHIKDANNKFYIPGSSIKGAIRTALLYTVLQERKPDININHLLYGINGTDIRGVLNVSEGKWAGMEIEKFIFRAGFRKKDGIISYSDAKYDLLKFIQFSDAYPLEANYSLMPIRTFSSVSEKEMKITYINIVEVIESGEFTFNLEIDMKGLLALKNIDEKDEWLGLKEKFKNIFGFNLDELNNNNLEEYKEKIIKRLLFACLKFYKKKRESDLAFIDNKEVRDKNISFNLESLKKNYPEVKEGVIQLGFGGGWKGKTIGMYFDQKTIDEFRKRFPKRWRGKIKNGSPSWPFPKTLRLAYWCKNNKPFIFPLGWISLE